MVSKSSSTVLPKDCSISSLDSSQLWVGAASWSSARILQNSTGNISSLVLDHWPHFMKAAPLLRIPHNRRCHAADLNFDSEGFSSVISATSMLLPICGALRVRELCTAYKHELFFQLLIGQKITYLIVLKVIQMDSTVYVCIRFLLVKKLDNCFENGVGCKNKTQYILAIANNGMLCLHCKIFDAIASSQVFLLDPMSSLICLLNEESYHQPSLHVLKFRAVPSEVKGRYRVLYKRSNK